MSVKITARIPTVQYGYLEVEADSTGEFEEVYAWAEEKAALITDPSRAVQNLANAGLIPAVPVTAAPVAGPPPWAAPTDEAQQAFIPPAPQAQPPQGWQPSVPAPQPGAQVGPTPRCKHGHEAKWVPPGIGKKTNKPFAGFYACPLPQGQQCDMRS